MFSFGPSRDIHTIPPSLLDLDIAPPKCYVRKKLKFHNRKLSSYVPRRIFLLRCKQKHLSPNFIRNLITKLNSLWSNTHASYDRRYINDTCSRIAKMILYTELEIANRNIAYHRKGISRIIASFENHPNQHTELQEIANLTSEVTGRQIDRRNARLGRKLAVLTSVLKDTKNLTVNPDFLVNLTDSVIDSQTELALSLGHKFAVHAPDHYQKRSNLITDLEPILECIEDPESRNDARVSIIRSLPNHTNKGENASDSDIAIRTHIATCTRHAVRFFKDHQDIVITYADKGNITVLLTTNDYHSKMDDLLSSSDYTPHHGDPFYSLEKTHNSIISELTKKNLITTEQRKKLSQPPSNLPRIYGLPKIHKPGVPLRPVVSTIGSPAYNLSSFCADILNATRNEYNYNVKNTAEFLERVNSISVTSDHHMFSLDVKSLYTSVSYHTAINVLKEKWERISNHTTLNSTTFLKLIRFCIDTAGYVHYNNKVYKQTKGLAMGSPLSAVIADLVLDHIIHKILEEHAFDIILFTKYVDDIFVIADKDDVEHILQAFNSAHTDFQFTIEHEEDGSIPFLDIQLIRQGNNLVKKWYRKPSNKGRLIDFWSSHPHHVKENCILTFARKVFHYSDTQFIDESKQIITTTLRDNHYPDKMIKKAINCSLLRNPPTTTRIDDSDSTRNIYRSITYCPPVSSSIKQHIESKSAYIKIIQKPSQKIGQLLFSNMKPKIVLLRKRFVVYKVNCLDCVGCYIGHTGKRLEQRMQEHKNDCRLRRNNGSGTALSSHSLELQHNFDFENPKVLAVEHNKLKRELLEVLHIRAHPNAVNFRVDSTRIHPTYDIG